MATKVSDSTRDVRQDRPAAAKPVAVIDIGTSSIRMAIAEISPDRSVRILERLAHGVNLGKDTFNTGNVEEPTIKECVRVLRSYRQRLQEYQITPSPQQVRIVATSAVREANNRLNLVDRIYAATGFEVELIDEADVHRAMYLGIQPVLRVASNLDAATALIIEVGGGSTNVLGLEGSDVSYAHTFRLGSLRLREMLETYRAPTSKLHLIIDSHIERTFGELVQHMKPASDLAIVVLGGDVRFAAAQLVSNRSDEGLTPLPLEPLRRFTEKMLDSSPDELIGRFHLTLPEAETLGPALRAYCKLAEMLGRKELMVSDVNLRDALLNEMAAGELWTEDFTNQIFRSALALARKFHVDLAHACHVAALSREMFRQLQSAHQLETRYELILYVAALLHEVGMYVSDSHYHQHSGYLINHSHVFGLGPKDVRLIALVARYHRQASPKPEHRGYASLDRDSRVAVAKMAALLRLCDCLDQSRSQRIHDIRCHYEEADRLVISVAGVDDLSLEQLAIQQKRLLFEQVFGLQVLLRRRRN
jgi:exopolyphosphatase/guanosine-5'-triphosphate,3'-diphosphate pyrophosphatase